MTNDRYARSSIVVLAASLMAAPAGLKSRHALDPTVRISTIGANSVATDKPPERAVMYGVGDIGWCADMTHTRATGRLMQALLDADPGSIGFTLGDNSNDSGSEADYRCLNDTAWATLAWRLFPVPGNHDYQTDPVFPHYLLYFAQARGPKNEGYYSYNHGGWHVMALNSELMSHAEHMKRRRQTQLDWIDNDLRNNQRDCTMAYFHRPPFSSGRNASPAWVMPLFQKLYRAGVDLVVTGHEHFFAAYPPLNPEGKIDDEFGVGMLTVGTGGAAMFNDPVKRNYKEMLLAKVPGIAKIALGKGRYDWWFIDTEGRVPRFSTGREVSGFGRCHGNPKFS